MKILAREIQFNERSMYSLLSSEPLELKMIYVNNEERDEFERIQKENGAEVMESFYKNDIPINWSAIPIGEYPDITFGQVGKFLKDSRERSLVFLPETQDTYYPNIGMYSTSSPAVKIPKRTLQGEFVDWDYDYLIHTDGQVNLDMADILGIEVPHILTIPVSPQGTKGRFFPRNMHQALIKKQFYMNLKVRGVLSTIRTYDGLVLAESEFWRIFQGSRLNDSEREARRKLTIQGDYAQISFPALLRQLDLNRETLIDLLNNSYEQVMSNLTPEFKVIFETFKISLNDNYSGVMKLYEEMEMERIDLRMVINVLQGVYYDSIPSILSTLPLYGVDTQYMSEHQDVYRWFSSDIPKDEYVIKFTRAKADRFTTSLDFHN